MIPATLFKQGARSAGLLSLVVPVLAALLLGVLGVRLPQWPSQRGGGDVTVAERVANPSAADSAQWSVFSPMVSRDDLNESGPVHDRYRLAGTFFEFTERGSSSRQAIIEDVAAGRQEILREGAQLGDFTVARILRDRVSIHDSRGQVYELWLRSSAGNRNAPGGASAQASSDGSSTNSFGAKQLGERRWRFDRARMLDYYESLRDEPERLVLLFDSMKPVYTADNFIEGYRLGVEGEEEFFSAVGLREGDIVRRVNDIKMINRGRAEFFIKQFAENAASAFVLDVERGGVVQSFTYEVR